MSRRLQVRLEEYEYLAIREAARRQGITVSEWVRRVLRGAIDSQSIAIEAKLRAIADASRHSYPTADIETMLGEIKAGQRLG